MVLTDVKRVLLRIFYILAFNTSELFEHFLIIAAPCGNKEGLMNYFWFKSMLHFYSCESRPSVIVPIHIKSYITATKIIAVLVLGIA